MHIACVGFLFTSTYAVGSTSDLWHCITPMVFLLVSVVLHTVVIQAKLQSVQDWIPDLVLVNLFVLGLRVMESYTEANQLYVCCCYFVILCMTEFTHWVVYSICLLFLDYYACVVGPQVSVWTEHGSRMHLFGYICASVFLKWVRLVIQTSVQIIKNEAKKRF